MVDLSRRRANETFESWDIVWGDVTVGRMSQMNGIESNVHWAWCCGFYPGCETRQQSTGKEDTFDEARAAFQIAWDRLKPEITSAMLDEWREQQAFTAWKYAMHDARCRMPTASTSGRSKCFCGDEITMANHCDHVYAKHSLRQKNAPQGRYTWRAC